MSAAGRAKSANGGLRPLSVGGNIKQQPSPRIVVPKQTQIPQHFPQSQQTQSQQTQSQNGSQSTQAQPRKIVGQYMLGKTIGEGTFGKVKLAIHLPTGEKVAVKILEKNKIKEQADIRRVNREIKILKKARHRNIIQLYEVLDTPNTIYLMMECAEGGEMFDYIVAHRHVPEIQACKFFHQIVDGVDVLHRNEITHRDLKPENLLLKPSPDGWIVKIVDFGLSNTHEGGRLLGTACGSPCYAAPEMIAGKQYKGPLADIWSLGVILFALVCGYLPFEDPNTALLYKKILSGEYTPAKWISPEVRDLIRRVLETDPTRRYTIADIRRHPWYNLVPESAIPREHPSSSDNDYARAQALQTMAEKSVPSQVVLDDLASHCCNATTATYYLLEQKFRSMRAKEREALTSQERQRQTSIASSSSSLTSSGKTAPIVNVERERERGQEGVSEPYISSSNPSPRPQPNIVGVPAPPLVPRPPNSQQPRSNPNSNSGGLTPYHQPPTLLQQQPQPSRTQPTPSSQPLDSSNPTNVTTSYSQITRPGSGSFRGVGRGKLQALPSLQPPPLDISKPSPSPSSISPLVPKLNLRALADQSQGPSTLTSQTARPPRVGAGVTNRGAPIRSGPGSIPSPSPSAPSPNPLRLPSSTAQQDSRSRLVCQPEPTSLFIDPGPRSARPAHPTDPVLDPSLFGSMSIGGPRPSSRQTTTSAPPKQENHLHLSLEVEGDMEGEVHFPADLLGPMPSSTESRPSTRRSKVRSRGGEGSDLDDMDRPFSGQGYIPLSRDPEEDQQQFYHSVRPSPSPSQPSPATTKTWEKEKEKETEKEKEKDQVQIIQKQSTLEGPAPPLRPAPPPPRVSGTNSNNNKGVDSDSPPSRSTRPGNPYLTGKPSNPNPPPSNPPPSTSITTSSSSSQPPPSQPTATPSLLTTTLSPQPPSQPPSSSLQPHAPLSAPRPSALGPAGAGNGTGPGGRRGRNLVAPSSSSSGPPPSSSSELDGEKQDKERGTREKEEGEGEIS